jgi:hypothetical protein
MILNFILIGLGWSLIYQAKIKADTYSNKYTPIWFSSKRFKIILNLLNILCSFLFLVLSFLIFSWLGIIYCLIYALIIQFLIAIIFNDSLIKYPVPIYIAGIFLVTISIILYLMGIKSNINLTI